jgi:hypothetical protein
MTESMTDPRRQTPDVVSRPEAPDVWFSDPPDEQVWKGTPSSAGIPIVFSSPARDAG